MGLNPECPASVYVMRSGNLLKIGMSEDPAKRLRQLQLGSSAAVALVTSRQFSTRLSAAAVEGALHRRFWRRSSHGEWFKAEPDEVSAALASMDDPNLHSDGWHPGMPPDVAQGTTIERWRWCRDNGVSLEGKGRF